MKERLCPARLRLGGEVEHHARTVDVPDRGGSMCVCVCVRGKRVPWVRVYGGFSCGVCGGVGEGLLRL